MTKSEVIRKIAQEWQNLGEVLHHLSNEQMLEPNVVGTWSVKDLMTHLSSWESVCLDRLGRVRRDEEIHIVPDTEVHAWNARFREQNQNVKLEIVQGEFESVHARLVQEIEVFPEELWNRNARGVVDWISDNTFQHYREHLDKLTDALARRGISIQTKASQ